MDDANLEHQTTFIFLKTLLLLISVQERKKDKGECPAQGLLKVFLKEQKLK